MNSIGKEISLMGTMVGRLVQKPVETMRDLPEFSWVSLILLQTTAAVVSGALVGLLGGNIFDAILGVLVFPVFSLMVSLAVTFFLAHFFSFFFDVFLDRKRLYGVVVVSHLPYFIVHVFATWVSPLDLLGFAITCIMMAVGLVEHFQLERKHVFRIIGGIWIVFFLVWAASQVTSANGF